MRLIFVLFAVLNLARANDPMIIFEGRGLDFDETEAIEIPALFEASNIIELLYLPNFFEYGDCSIENYNSTFFLNMIERIKIKKPIDTILTWKIKPNNLNLKTQINLVSLAFRTWSQSTPLLFLEADNMENADICIEFEEGNKGTSVTFTEKKAFIMVSHGGELNKFVETLPITNALLHSLGHLFGLKCTTNPLYDSIMYYTQYRKNYLSVGVDAKREAREILGHCQFKFDYVSDIYGLQYDNTYFETHFFSNKYVWVYNNYLQTTDIARMYIKAIYGTSFKTNLVSVVNIFHKRPNKGLKEVLLCEADKMYLSNGTLPLESLEKNFKDFECEIEFSPIQNTLYIPFNDRIYFFTEHTVLEYEYIDFDSLRCPRRSLSFKELFITNYKDQLADGVDHVYVSNHYRSVFFFKNEELYKVADTMLDQEKDNYLMSLEHLGKWWFTFPDVCDTDPFDARIFG